MCGCASSSVNAALPLRVSAQTQIQPLRDARKHANANSSESLFMLKRAQRIDRESPFLPAHINIKPNPRTGREAEATEATAHSDRRKKQRKKTKHC